MVKFTGLLLLASSFLGVRQASSSDVSSSSFRISDNVIFVTDPLIAGPSLETIHAFYGQFPTGVAVSSTGRIFANFPAGLDAGNTNNGSPGIYQVAELTDLTTEVAYPSMEMNTPPGGAVNYLTSPATGANYADYLIAVQSVVIDPADRLWILDTGRPIDPTTGEQVAAVGDGPKLVGVNLTTDTVFQTITFPASVALSTGYLNDVRFDLRPNITESGQGVAYITDSSGYGIIVVDLGTGESWQHLYDPSVAATRPEKGFVGFIWGAVGNVTNNAGADGIALSPDGETLYVGPITGRTVYGIPTALLRQRGEEAALEASVQSLGQKGWSDGFECDSNGIVYVGNNELNAIATLNPANGTVGTFVRDPRINWVDTSELSSCQYLWPIRFSKADIYLCEVSIATDGYLYFVNNQLQVETKVRPFGLFRAPLPDGGTKIGG